MNNGFDILRNRRLNLIDNIYESDIEKAQPVGTINKYGKMKMPDGSWKYVKKEKVKWSKNKGIKSEVKLVDLSLLKTNPNEVWSKKYETTGFGNEYTNKISAALKKNTLMPAIIVKKDNNIIIDGQHRFKGAIKAGLLKIGVQYV